MSTDGSCGDCKHWNRDREDYRSVVTPEFDSGFGETPESIERDRAYGECKAVPMGPVEKGAPLPPAVAMDGSEYIAILYTLADFGCRSFVAASLPVGDEKK